ncbi:DUF2303 family protein [Ectopseudomonas alcaliphila]|uniref:DUF2303 family protein n=1 Tax=Ectopseudomonas alcaliphila TaxID=101564 RepID=A0A1G7MQQ2_9GAMM|nr:DUF2303 family protein [Pseudomonas alcaliphila]MDX5994914.1 DUF2303 family protein [Pseudomonas alcaliphila]SDF64082.1 Uncharacterized conserved protein YfdQ, DUF2303 family [Pseudomonas alcaliphila]
MFDHKALDTLNAQAVAAAQVSIQTSGNQLAVLPANCTTLNLEQFQSHRDRFRGSLHTHALKAFSAYVERHIGGEEDTGAAGFVDQDAMSATVIFNLGTPDDAGHGDDRATLTLKPTAAYKALNEVVGRSLSQQQLAEFLEDWAPHLVASAGDQKLGTPSAINAIRRMSIKAIAEVNTEVGDLNNRRSAMEEIEAKSLETLPTAFVFSAKPYDPLSVADITLRLSVITGDKSPVLKLRWVGQEAQQEAFAEEFQQVLDGEIGGLLPLTIGTYSQGK